MSSLKFFELHHSILNTIFSIYKLERFNILPTLITDPTVDNQHLEIIAMLKVPLVPTEIINILTNYSQIDPHYKTIDFSNSILKSQINVKTP